MSFLTKYFLGKIESRVSRCKRYNLNIVFGSQNVIGHFQDNGIHCTIVLGVEQTSFAWVSLRNCQAVAASIWYPGNISKFTVCQQHTIQEYIRGISKSDNPILRALLQRAMGLFE